MLNVTYNNIKVFFTEDTNGGGLNFNDEFLDAIKFIFKDKSIKKSRITYTNFVSGPGFFWFLIV